MNPDAKRVPLEEILSLRTLFLQEANHQVRYNACHERGWTDSYLLIADSVSVGYGSIKGREIPERDTVFEYFVVPPFRKYASDLFRSLLAAANPQFIECQSNDPLLSSMLFEFAHGIHADVVLFEDHCVTRLELPDAQVRRKHADEKVFSHQIEPVGEHVLELNGEVIATGGFLLHYNHPFADLYMEVREDCRRRGVASFLLQEVKRECYLAGRVPAARCGIGNAGSRAALCKAGLRVCGFMLSGGVDPGRL
ncbi:MAG TPA: GNAT family N-acetyltransferase [Terracidiphilus sp.]|nr:GNAT family N-acetyltransferase [Terracidiphilus sp.]